MGRQEQCKQISLVCVGSARSVLATLGLPPLTACVLSQSALLRLQVALELSKAGLGCMPFPGLSCSGSGTWVLHKGADSDGPAFCALPRSEQLRQLGAWQAHSPQVGRCVLSPPPSQRLSLLGVQGCTFSGVLCVSFVELELVSGCTPPGWCQPSRIPRSLG